MNGWTEMTVRRNRDGSVTMTVTSEQEPDPVHLSHERYDWILAHRRAREWLDVEIERALFPGIRP